MSKGQTLQDPFLNSLRKDRIPVSIFLVNGIKLQGQIESFDQYVVLLKNTVSQMVYKHAISTVVPARNPRTSSNLMTGSSTGMQPSSGYQSAYGNSTSGGFDRSATTGFEAGGFANKRSGFNRGGFTERGFNQERGGFSERGVQQDRGFETEHGFDDNRVAPEARGFEERDFDKRGFTDAEPPRHDDTDD